MKIKMQFFGPAQEAAGTAAGFVEVGKGARVSDVARAAFAAYPGLARLDRARLRFAVNVEYAVEDTALKEGDVVSLIPPVGGG